MPLRLESHTDGTILSIHAQPGAKKTGVVGKHDGALKLAVTVPADQGKANEAIVTLLAKTLGVAKREVEILSGHTSRSKRVLVRGIHADEVRRRLNLEGDSTR